MSRDTAALIVTAALVGIIWLLFTHWQTGVSVLLILILLNQISRR